MRAKPWMCGLGIGDVWGQVGATTVSGMLCVHEIYLSRPYHDYYDVIVRLYLFFSSFLSFTFTAGSFLFCFLLPIPRYFHISLREPYPTSLPHSHPLLIHTYPHLSRLLLGTTATWS